MKKTKKFDDGGPTGGHYVMNGDSGIYVDDAPVADVPVAASIPAAIGPRRLGPMSGGVMPPPSISQDVSRPMGGRFDSGVPEGMGKDRADFNMVGRFDSGMTGQAAMKKGGAVKKMVKGGKTATVRGHGCEQRGKTKGRFV